MLADADAPIGAFLDELEFADRTRFLAILKDACGPYWVSEEAARHITREYALGVLEAVKDCVAGDAADSIRRVHAKARAEWMTS